MSKLYEIEKLEPKGVLTWFKRICAIPHGSGNEKQLCDMLANELAKIGAKIKRFPTGAVYASVKATKGYEKCPMTLLQAHTDMILAQEEGMGLDLNKQAITPFYDTVKKWLKAEGTTLGADNGIAVAMFMEVATNPKIEHGPLELFFTTGEETDPSVCLGQVPKGFFKSKYLINLDSDKEENIFYASGCCVFFTAKHKLTYVPVKPGTKTYNIYITGLTGGHSGLEIHHNHINCIIFLMNILREFSKEHYCNLVSFAAGNAANAIPTYITCDVQLNAKDVKALQDKINQKIADNLIITQNYDKNINCKIKLCQQEKKCIKPIESERLMNLLSVIPDGTFNYLHECNCMYNSSNMGVLKVLDGVVHIECSQRSFIEDDAQSIRSKIITIFKQFGFKDSDIHLKDGCSAWLVREPEKSALIQLWKKNYIKVWGKKPNIVPNPGGLEVAEITKKCPVLQLNSLSAGPRIWAEHTTNESCPIVPIQNVWKVLTLTLKGMKK